MGSDHEHSTTIRTGSGMKSACALFSFDLEGEQYGDYGPTSHVFTQIAARTSD